MFWHFWILRQHHFLKNVLNTCFWVFIAFGFYLLFIADERFQPYPKFQAGMAFLSVFAMFLPYLVFRSTTLYERYHASLLVYFEFLVVAPLVLNGIGARWLYDLNIEYDTIVHFSNSFFLGLLAMSLLWLADRQMIDRAPHALFILMIVGIFLAGVFFEGFESFSDAYWHTSMWGEGHTNIIADTRLDVIANTLGGVASSILFFFGGYRRLDHIVAKST